MLPEQSQVAWIAPGIAKAVCPDCKRMIYAERIDAAIDTLNLPKGPSELPLFATISN